MFMIQGLVFEIEGGRPPPPTPALYVIFLAGSEFGYHNLTFDLIFILYDHQFAI